MNHDKDVLKIVEEKKKTTDLTIELESLRDDLARYKVSKGEWWEEKKEFLKSTKFYDLLGARSDFLFDCGFKGAIQKG